ncbi:hypothetical protein PINS_up006669 [Pythium insidiosum]|nr:hypothetical protein PINS_up006669 [Pythium insidiosum]
MRRTTTLRSRLSAAARQRRLKSSAAAAASPAAEYEKRDGSKGKIVSERAFIEFKRQPDAYRGAAERVHDWNEINTDFRDPGERKVQAARCMDCGTPFCQTHTGCPVNNLIPEWNELVFRDEWKEAIDRLHKTNNFPEFTGRVCPAPCESACVAGLVDDPITIKNNEYAIVDRAWEEGWIVPRIPRRNGLSVAVVGSGPAGLAAADQLNQKGFEVTVFEREDRVGGLLMYGIPNMKLEKKTGRAPRESAARGRHRVCDERRGRQERAAVEAAAGARRGRALHRIDGAT